MQALLFSMLQEQHEKQMAMMAESNKTNMDAMMEKMNALVAAGRSRSIRTHDKENHPLPGPTPTVGGSGGGGNVSKWP